MSRPNYTLEVISHHPTFKNKSLRKYSVEGIETVGAWGDEPFEIKFTNHTWQKVQVKISVDGTDVLTGDPATTDVGKQMWVVNGYGTLSLKAWPETNNGGAQFVFTSANNSVAVHTHGDLSSRGIIAAAVFVEGYVEPIRVNPYPHYDYHGWVLGSGGPLYGSGTTCRGLGGGGTYSSSSISFNATKSCDSFGGSTSDSFTLSDASQNFADTDKSLESLVAVGAGQHVDQKISYVTGLIKPTFTETVRVKYMWWDELVSKLRQANYPMPHASGFPGDAKKVNINLGATPRIGTYQGQAFPRQSEPTYLRV